MVEEGREDKKTERTPGSGGVQCWLLGWSKEGSGGWSGGGKGSVVRGQRGWGGRGWGEEEERRKGSGGGWGGGGGAQRDEAVGRRRGRVGPRMRRKAPGWGRFPGSLSPRWGALGWRGILPGPALLSSPGPRPLSLRAWKGMRAEGRGRGKGSDPGPRRGTRGMATQGEGRRGPRARAGPGAGLAGRGRARGQNDRRTDRLTAAWASHHHGRGSLLRPRLCSTPRS
jgi:hypothetical protein